ncbi:MAG: tripartite tricarboxylate transporter substrate binding protein [Pseudomonadota bacterium]
MKRQFLQRMAAAALSAAACLAAPLALAQANYPDHPIRMVVPFPPGGSVDPIARVVGVRLGELLGQPIVIDNRAGGNTSIAAGFVAKAPADGYTLFFTAGSTHVIHTMQTSLPYDPIKDFAPIGIVSRSGYMIAVHPSVPAKTLPEFIAYAKANPGKLNYASSGIGNANHLAGELFNILAGTQIVHVPYKGGAPALQDFLAGRVQVMITNVPGAQPHVDAGKLRALAYTSQLPHHAPVPTFAQYGMPDFAAIESLNVLLAPAGTPAPIIEKISVALKKVLAMPDVIAGIDAQKQEAWWSTPAQLGARLVSDKAKYTEVIEKANVKLTP